MYFDKFVNVIVEIVQIFVFLKTCLDVNTQYAMYIKIFQKYFIGISFIYARRMAPIEGVRLKEIENSLFKTH